MLENIDVKTRKLLYELELNSRKPASLLAKKVKMSKSAVIYRLQQLEKKGVIEGYHANIDLGKLGYFTMRLMLNLKNAPPTVEKEIIEFLKEKEIVKWLGAMEGPYNIGMTLVTRDISEADKLWSELREKYINYFDERLFTLIMHRLYFTKSYLLGKSKNEKEIIMLSPPKAEKLDSLDIKIINEISKNSRIHAVDLAEKLKVTVKTVISHLRDLEKRKIIANYGLRTNLSALGYQSFRVHLTLMKVSAQEEEDFIDYCQQNPYIVADEDALGGSDFEIEIQVPGVEHLRKIIEEIKENFSDIVHDYDIYHIYKEYKDSLPLLEN